MYHLLKLIIKYHFFLLFLFIEIIAILLAVNFNKHHNTVYLSSANEISGNINKSLLGVTSYFNLNERNKLLLTQNKLLLNKSKASYLNNKKIVIGINDTIYNQQYKYTTATIVKNSIYNKHNYLSLNKGKNNNISEQSAVISPTGIVGVVSKTSNNFCNVISVLNTSLSISAKIKKNNYFGSLNWDGINYRYIKLKEIPFHVELQKGDTIVTSGYSLMFPEGVLVGEISSFNKTEGGDFYDITIKLFTDFKNVTDVYIVKNLKKNEMQNLSEHD